MQALSSRAWKFCLHSRHKLQQWQNLQAVWETTQEKFSLRVLPLQLRDAASSGLDS